MNIEHSSFSLYRRRGEFFTRSSVTATWLSRFSSVSLGTFVQSVNAFFFFLRNMSYTSTVPALQQRKDGPAFHYLFYIVHSVHYDILKHWSQQQTHNSTLCVLFLLSSSYMFRHCRHLQEAYAKIANICFDVTINVTLFYTIYCCMCWWNFCVSSLKVTTPKYVGAK